MAKGEPHPRDKYGNFIKQHSIWLIVHCKHDEELEGLDDKIEALEEKLVEVVNEVVKDSPIEGKVLAGVGYTKDLEGVANHFKRNRSLQAGQKKGPRAHRRVKTQEP